jgi:hypothetical protein
MLTSSIVRRISDSVRRFLARRVKVPPPDSPSFKATERAYGGKDAYRRAKAAGRTKLNYQQWVQARTHDFLSSFGDWEAVRGRSALERLQPVVLDGLRPVPDQKTVENLFHSFGMVVNEQDKRNVRFPASMAGKIITHKGFDVLKIVRAFDHLFQIAVPMTSELEEARPGHKDHTSNIAGYHQYVSLFEQGGKIYYVRFTVQGMKARHGKEGQNLAHSSYVSNVTLYERVTEIGKGADINSASYRDSPRSSETTPLDNNLAQWLARGKENLQGATDPYTGEPLATEI